jgi:hypothetical protein
MAKKQKYVIIRTYSAGVFSGELVSYDKKEREATLHNARRLWRWEGSASLSQMAMSGTSKPQDCKFPEEVKSVVLPQVIEILEITEVARKSIAEVPVWKS